MKSTQLKLLPEEYSDWFNYIFYIILFMFEWYLLWLTSRSCSQYNDIQSLHAIMENNSIKMIKLIFNYRLWAGNISLWWILYIELA